MTPDQATSHTSVLQYAIEYTRRGWSVLPVPYRSKNPGFKGWEQMRLTVESLDQHFKGQPQNIGVLLGEPSGWVIDVDLDHMRAVELAPQFLPDTPAIFGRPGNPRSHWIYRVSTPAATKKFRSQSAGMLVEFRSTGMQTVFPPSTHESGESIEWEYDDAEPAEVDPQSLLEAVKLLADTVKIELGEKHASPRSKSQRKCTDSQSTTIAPPPVSLPSEERAACCLTAMLRIRVVDQRDGSHRLFVAACRAVEHDLDDALAVATICQYAQQRPFPRVWTEDEIIRRIRDAEVRCERGAAWRRDANGFLRLGSHDPKSGRLVLSPKRTLPTAEAYVREFHLHPDGPTLVSQADAFLAWQNGRYVEVEDCAFQHRLQTWLHEALRYVYNRASNETVLAEFESNHSTVAGALESVRAYTHIPAAIPNPSWLGEPANDPPAAEVLACRSSLIHLPTMKNIQSTPRFFATTALEFDHDPQAPTPAQWLSFLNQLWPDDRESLELLQEWFGYCLTGNTTQQKMMLIVGPKRSGKGTIARVLANLIGIGNVCGPTTSSLAGPFGLQPLLGKTLAVVSDARFHGEHLSTVVERLLCISGEDTVTVDRKHKTSCTTKLNTRFLFLTNEFPRLQDASGALAGRFVILRLTESFYGQEDIGLTDRLLTELPGILLWAIEGWRHLRERGHFVVPAAVQDVVQEIEYLSSPVHAFVQDECQVGQGHRVDVDTLYAAWRSWCEREGRQWIGQKQTFGRDLAAAVPGIKRRRSTDQFSFYEGITLKIAQ